MYEDQKVFLLPEHLGIRWHVSQCFDDRTLEAGTSRAWCLYAPSSSECFRAGGLTIAGVNYPVIHAEQGLQGGASPPMKTHSQQNWPILRLCAPRRTILISSKSSANNEFIALY